MERLEQKKREAMGRLRRKRSFQGKGTSIKDLGLALIPVILGLHRKQDHFLKIQNKKKKVSLYIKHSKWEK